MDEIRVCCVIRAGTSLVVTCSVNSHVSQTRTRYVWDDLSMQRFKYRSTVKIKLKAFWSIEIFSNVGKIQVNINQQVYPVSVSPSFCVQQSWQLTILSTSGEWWSSRNYGKSLWAEDGDLHTVYTVYQLEEEGEGGGECRINVSNYKQHHIEGLNIDFIVCMNY